MLPKRSLPDTPHVTDPLWPSRGTVQCHGATTTGLLSGNHGNGIAPVKGGFLPSGVAPVAQVG